MNDPQFLKEWEWLPGDAETKEQYLEAMRLRRSGVTIRGVYDIALEELAKLNG